MDGEFGNPEEKVKFTKSGGEFGYLKIRSKKINLEISRNLNFGEVQIYKEFGNPKENLGNLEENLDILRRVWRR